MMKNIILYGKNESHFIEVVDDFIAGQRGMYIVVVGHGVHNGHVMTGRDMSNIIPLEKAIEDYTFPKGSFLLDYVVNNTNEEYLAAQIRSH